MFRFSILALLLVFFPALASACPPQLRQFLDSCESYSQPLQRIRYRYVEVEPIVEDVEVCVEEYVEPEPQQQRRIVKEYRQRSRSFEAYRDACDADFRTEVRQFRSNVGNAYSYRQSFSQNNRQFNRDRQPIFNGRIREGLRNIVSLPFRAVQNFSQRAQEFRQQRNFQRFRARQNFNGGGNYSRSERFVEEFNSY